MAQITLVDTTLRDGSHAVRHQFNEQNVADLASGLDRAGIPVIEITHGDGLGGSSLQYGRSLLSDEEMISIGVDTVQDSKVAVLLLPGIGTHVELERALDLGAKVVRVATHCTEADISAQHIEMTKSRGALAVGFLMMAHMLEPDDLAKQAQLMASYGADVVYVTDSAGALLPDMVGARVRALRSALDDAVEIGFHGHNNLGLAVGNSLVAVESGATWIDGAMAGFGAGAGNTATEVVAAALDKAGHEVVGVDIFELMRVAEEKARPLLPSSTTISRSALMLGYAGVYSSFLLHAYRASERFGVDPAEILLELGQRKMVGGQEDMIVDVAIELSQGRADQGATNSR
ncbi:4-hydroxy 2-oxovalerate aldolase [Ferrithrix thermotolerans DSM 19514]|jgi:4-hydroxy-2-oxovalerate aldolase|uniref:4-hydroxy-2-oxovalerate aldolase n=1 Tax=Ferrithrix thermotolerans DSM 19514 TaxID=1121881 RepID=A0A1M4V1W6_9ACTN|nr:4-hydroxy-2-oxovalerate aldolase [Ferrithrix thermotolerans]SHE62981.1 4-hydroxy 2-oxovalerate aldolase [Ferrithrix thermotolerans DSM 19514]